MANYFFFCAIFLTLCFCVPSQVASKSVCQRHNCNQYADGENCAAFYVWSKNKRVVGHRVCRRGLLYNRKLKSCDLPQNVDCTGIPIISEFRKTDIGDESGFFVNPDNCGEYFIFDGKKRIRSCPDGLLFDKESRLCERANYVSC